MKQIIETSSLALPDNWQSRNSESINEWFDRLPIPYSLKEVERNEMVWEDMKLKNGL